MFNGTNNGAIFLSVRDATARLGFADCKAAQAAFTELSQFGWITETVAGCFRVKAGEISRARAWQLNWIGRDGKSTSPDALPALTYSTLTKAQKRRVERRQTVLSRYLKDYQRGHFAVEESTTMMARMAAAEPARVEDSTTLERRIGRKLPISSAQESTTHIKYHSPATPGCVAARRARLRLAVIACPLEKPSNDQLAAGARAA